MKRNSYVDKKGNTIDPTFISKKPILNFFFFVGTIIPIIIIGFIIYTMILNSTCNKIYNSIKVAALDYIKDENKVPALEGDSISVDIRTLYSKKYLNEYYTNNKKNTGTVKITKYKNNYIYTLDVKNCKSCSTSKKYKNWTSESSIYPSGKSIVDVTPYYNYYGRQLNTTNWSDYFEQDELEDKNSKYGVKLPLEETRMPEVPKDGKIIDVKKQEKVYYKYQDKEWKWYDIIGDYSDFSSEQPAGYSNKDEDTEITTEWSKYSQNYPEEKDYREIKSEVGYKYYYEKKGKKYYANNGNYIPEEEVNTEKYDQREDDSVTLYQYQDYLWRWYNGQKRSYSSYSADKPEEYNYRDEGIYSYSGDTSWNEESYLTEENKSYRKEDQKIVVRYCYVYEFLTQAYLPKPVTKEKFEKKLKMTTLDFSKQDNYKLEITYKFRYRKS